VAAGLLSQFGKRQIYRGSQRRRCARICYGQRSGMDNQSRDRIAKLDLVIILAVGDKHEPGFKNFSPPADCISLGMERSFSKKWGGVEIAMLFSGFAAELTEVNQLRISSLNLKKFSKHASQHVRRFVTVNSRITKS
jgi:hypothetical protein